MENTTPPAAARKHHVLIAEDAEGTGNTFAAILRKGGYEVSLAKDGSDALRQIIALHKAGTKIDILVTDIWMDGLDGLQLIDQLGKLNMSIPTLAMTGNSDKDLIIDLMRKGCQDYIEKPFGAVELLQHVANIIKRHEQKTA